MTLIKKYSQWQSVPTHIQDAYMTGRYSVVAPNNREFRITIIDWSKVDWINYIAMKGRMWNKKGKDIKI